MSNQELYREMLLKTTGNEQEKWSKLYEDSMNEGLNKILDNLNKKGIPIWYMKDGKLNNI